MTLALTVGKGMMEILPTVLMQQGKTVVINTTHNQNPGKPQSPAHRSEIPPILSTETSRNGLEDAWGFVSICKAQVGAAAIQNFSPAWPSSHGFAVWQHTCFSSGAKLLILS